MSKTIVEYTDDIIAYSEEYRHYINCYETEYMRILNEIKPQLRNTSRHKRLINIEAKVWLDLGELELEKMLHTLYEVKKIDQSIAVELAEKYANEKIVLKMKDESQENNEVEKSRWRGKRGKKNRE